MKKFLCISFLTFSIQLVARHNQIDSLETILKTVNADTQKIIILNKLAWELKSNNSQKTIDYASQALHLSEEIIYKEGIAVSYNNIGSAFFKLGEYNKAKDNFLHAMLVREEMHDSIGIAPLLNNIASLHYIQGNYEKASEFFLKALAFYEKAGNIKSTASILSNLGNLFDEQKQYPKAEEYFFRSLEYREKLGDSAGIASCYNNIANVFANTGKIDEAEKFYEKALEIRKFLADQEGMATTYSNIGGIAWMKQDHKKALDYFSQALKIHSDIENKNGMSLTYINLGGVFADLNDHEKSEVSLSIGIQIAKEIGALNLIMEGYKYFSRLFSNSGNYQKAFEYHTLYSQAKDSLLNEENSKQITEMQTKYETEKKELQIENLNKDNEIKSVEIKKQNFQKLAFASGFALMFILAFIIFRGYRQKQRANHIISNQKEEVENQKKIVDQKNSSLELAYKNIEEKNHEILDSIRYAKRIQEAILPPQKLITSYLENSFILYKPKDIVAGDFYWMHPLQKNVLFASVDCTGHGVPGAFVSILGHNCLNRCVKEFRLTQPAAILDKLCVLIDEAFSKSENDIKDGMDIALCSLKFPSSENETAMLEFAGAGNCLYHIRNSNLTEYKADKQPIGKFAFRKPFTNHNISLQKNDCIYIFTDGFADQFGGPKGKKFKYSQFENLLAAIHGKSMFEQKQILNESIENWKGELEQIDDICIIGVRS